MKKVKKLIIAILIIIGLVLLAHIVYWEYLGYKLENGWHPYIHKSIDNLKKEANPND